MTVAGSAATLAMAAVEGQPAAAAAAAAPAAGKGGLVVVQVGGYGGFDAALEVSKALSALVLPLELCCLRRCLSLPSVCLSLQELGVPPGGAVLVRPDR
eukprot:SAG22_NODE_606_length_8615_cov_6.190348_8_plen_99_part_00